MADQGILPLGKYLASADKKTRDKAVKSLVAFLTTSGGSLPPAEMAKLWKGIFYCFWMSDKPLVQQALATELADLLLAVGSTNAALAFLRGFWQATVREWNGIDRLRMDKYYMLVRRFVNASFRLLNQVKWREEICTEYNGILTGRDGPLTANNPRTPTSLAFHLAEIYLLELDKALSDTSVEDHAVPILILLDPFLSILGRTSSKHKYKQVQDAVLQPVFDSLSITPSSGSEDEDEDPRPRKRSRPDPDASLTHLRMRSVGAQMGAPAELPALRQALSKRVFEVASSEGTRDANRKRLYAFLKTVGVEGVDNHDE